ncbi:MAG: hypothetical protein JWM08_2225 [Candidatus Angelobacter sp.]|nr:hypothetical protein [Candidatus Angelobacter sp.]
MRASRRESPTTESMGGLTSHVHVLLLGIDREADNGAGAPFALDDPGPPKDMQNSLAEEGEGKSNGL